MPTSPTTESLTTLFKEVYADSFKSLFSLHDPEFERNKEFDNKLKELFEDE